MSDFKKGNQVAYFPDHIGNGDFSYPEVEFGFVTDTNGHCNAHIRYWTIRKSRMTLQRNSKLTLVVNLKPFKIKVQEEINELLKTL